MRSFKHLPAALPSSRNGLRWVIAGAALWLNWATAADVGGGVAAKAASRYTISTSTAGPDGMWDYASISPEEGRLYLAQGESISILDLKDNGGWSQIHVPGAMWHSVLPLVNRGLLLGTNGQIHGLAMFAIDTHAPLGSVTTSKGPTSKLSGNMARFAALADPDALLVDPLSGLAAAINGGSGEVAFVDLDKKEVVGKVAVGGKLEFAVTDGRGRLYVNVQTAHEVAVIDIAAKKVVQRIALAGCIEPKGLAYDSATGLLISACDNGVAKFILVAGGTIVASMHIGRGADAVIVDESRHRAFVPSGEEARLSIFDIGDPQHIELIQTLQTELGTRLGAVDGRNGRLYLPAGTLGPPIPPRPWPSIKPGSFHLLVVSPAAGS